MDVTPSPKMFEAMKQLVDATCGEEPSPLLVGPGASAIRIKRTFVYEALHRLVAIAMREGVNRKVLEIQAQREAQTKIPVFDKEDAEAVAKAKSDAEAGVSKTPSLTKH